MQLIDSLTYMHVVFLLDNKLMYHKKKRQNCTKIIYTNGPCCSILLFEWIKHAGIKWLCINRNSNKKKKQERELVKANLKNFKFVGCFSDTS